MRNALSILFLLALAACAQQPLSTERPPLCGYHYWIISPERASLPCVYPSDPPPERWACVYPYWHTAEQRAREDCVWIREP